MSTKSEEERAKFALRIEELERQLEEAHKNKEKAISQAQLTKSGHVYIISNIGSFGENVYKIGMTRRLDPLDRVKELGDASVPFPFDVHAMIYSEDAPGLENKIHKEFNNKSTNLVNLRKEFFNITLEEVENFVKENYGEFKLTKIAVADQYRQTLKMREENIKPIFNEDEEELEEVI
ncbi:GIY-YIG nuclease family protein (plasmid) [Cetobacterium somerae]